MKERAPNRLLGTILSTGLLINALPVSLPLNGKFVPLPGETIQQTVQRERLKGKIARKIKQIKSVTWRLKAAQIAIPSVIGLGGIAVTSIPLLLILIRVIKLGKLIKTMKGFRTGTLKPEKWKKINKMIKDLKNKTGSAIFFASAHEDYVFLSAKRIAELLENKAMKQLAKTILFGSAGAVVLGAITSALLGLTGITTAAAKKLFGLSTISVSKAFDNIKELTQIEKDNPAILTPQQKLAIIKLKKLQKSPIAQGIIKNLRLKNTLTKLVTTAIQNHPLFLVPRGKEKKRKKEKKMRKVFADYIKARRQASSLQKAADKYTAMNLSGSGPSATKRQLEKEKKKIAKLQTLYPGLGAALENAVQQYSRKEDEMLEELKKTLMETFETKKIKQPVPQQAIPL